MNIKDIKNSQFKDKNILITGCSKGIGRSLVIKLSQLGANVILLSRNEKKWMNFMTLLRKIMEQSPAF